MCVCVCVSKASVLVCRFRSMAPMYYRRANAALIVYDITRGKSFDEAKEWVRGECVDVEWVRGVCVDVEWVRGVCVDVEWVRGVCVDVEWVRGECALMWSGWGVCVCVLSVVVEHTHHYFLQSLRAKSTPILVSSY